MKVLNKITETVSELVNRCKADQIAIPIDIGCFENFFIKLGTFAAIRKVKEKNMMYLEYRKACAFIAYNELELAS